MDSIQVMKKQTMETNKEGALKHLRSFGYPPGAEGPATLEFWKTLDYYLRNYIITWDDLPHAKQTFENGSKKRGYTFSRPYQSPDPIPEVFKRNGDKKTKQPKENVLPSKSKPPRVKFFRRNRMSEDANLGPAPASFPADEATQELWDLNKKIVVSDEIENARRSRQQYDDRVGDVRVTMQQLQNVALQAVQNAVESANMLSKQALKHNDLIASQQLRDQSRDNYPADEQFDLGNADDEQD